MKIEGSHEVVCGAIRQVEHFEGQAAVIVCRGQRRVIAYRFGEIADGVLGLAELSKSYSAIEISRRQVLFDRQSRRVLFDRLTQALLARRLALGLPAYSGQLSLFSLSELVQSHA